MMMLVENDVGIVEGIPVSLRTAIFFFFLQRPLF